MRFGALGLALLLSACGPKLMDGIAPAAPHERAPELVEAPADELLNAHAEIALAALELELDEAYFRAEARIEFSLRGGEDTLFLYGDRDFLRESRLLAIGEEPGEDEEPGKAEKPATSEEAGNKEKPARAIAPIPTDREGLYAFRIPKERLREGERLTLHLRLEGPLDDERAPLVRVRDGGSEYWIPARNRPFLRPLFLDVDHLGGARRVELIASIDDRLHIVGSRPIASRERDAIRREERDRVVFEPAEGILARELVIAIGPFDKISSTLRAGDAAIPAELFATRGRGVQLAPTAEELNRAINIIEGFRNEPIGLDELRLLVSPFFQTIPYGLLVLDEQTGLAHSQREHDRADLFAITRAITELTLRNQFAPRTDADELLLWAMAYRESLDAIDAAEPEERMSEFFARSVERRKRFAELGAGLDEFRLISLIEGIVEERGEEGYRALFAKDDALIDGEFNRAPLSLARLLEQLGEAAPSLRGLTRVVFERSCTDDEAAIEASVLSGPKARICVTTEAKADTDAEGGEMRRCFTLDPEDALPERIELARCDAHFAPNLEGFGFYRSRLPKELILEFLKGRYQAAGLAERATFYHDAIDAAEYGAIDADAFEQVLSTYARSKDPLIARLPLRDLGRLVDEVSDPGERAWVASLLERYYLTRFMELGFERGGSEFDAALRAAIGEQLFRAPRDEALKKELLLRARSYLGVGERVDRLALAPELIAPGLAYAMGELGEEAIDAVMARFRQTVTNKERETLFGAFLLVEHPLAAAKVRELALEPVLAKESVLSILRSQLRRASSRKEALEFIAAESDALNLKFGERADVELAILAGELCEDVDLAASALPLDEAREAGFETEVSFALARATSCKRRMHHLREVNAELAGR